jgi:hypothetical protein
MAIHLQGIRILAGFVEIPYLEARARVMAIRVSKAIRRTPQLLLREVPISGIGAEHPAFMAIPAFDGFQGTETPFEIGIERGGIVCRYRTMPVCRLSSLAKSGGAKCRAQSVLIDITPTAVARSCAQLRAGAPRASGCLPPLGIYIPPSGVPCLLAHLVSIADPLRVLLLGV